MQNFKLSKRAFDMLVNDLRKLARENVTVKYDNGEIYVFGSELATLRIYRHRHTSKNARQAYSENLNTFFVRYEVGAEYAPTGEMESD